MLALWLVVRSSIVCWNSVSDVGPPGPTAATPMGKQDEEVADNAHLWIRSMEMQIGER